MLVKSKKRSHKVQREMLREGLLAEGGVPESALERSTNINASTYKKISESGSDDNRI